VADTQRWIHRGRYTAAPNQDTQWWTHSRSLGDLPDIETSPPCSTFRILGAAKPPPVLVLYIHAHDYPLYIVAGSPKVHGRDCLFRLHTMTVFLDFTRCSPSCSSYLRRTFVYLSCTYNQLTHSHQHILQQKMLRTVISSV